MDNRHKSSLIHKALKNMFNLFETQESFGAVEWLKHFQAAAIILDEAALTKTWPLFVQHIRRLPDYADIPILLITNNLKKTFTTQALNYGITDFLLDPLDPDEVYQRMLVHMKSSPIAKRVALLTKKIPRSSLQKIDVSLPKRFLVTEEVIRRIAQSRTAQRPLALVMIEINRFSEIEEKYKIEKTEKLLAQCIALFKTHLRKNDFLLPQGGARFLLIFPHTSHRAAVAIAEMIRKEVESTTFSINSSRISLTLSMGLNAFDTDPERNIYDQFDAFLKKVDRALIEAKDKK
jgi:diguanylate cyclase (GGDEF)-like protein